MYNNHVHQYMLTMSVTKRHIITYFLAITFSPLKDFLLHNNLLLVNKKTAKNRINVIHK